MVDHTLKIGEQSYKLAFDFNALTRVQSELGINLLDDEAFSPLRLRANFWSVLLLHQPSLKLEDAGRLITPANLKAVVEAVSNAWTDTGEDGTD